MYHHGKKPVLFVPHFFLEAYWLFAELAKNRPKGLRQFTSFNAKAFEALIRKKMKVTHKRAFWSPKQGHS
jgi:hypothetical protein